MLAPVARLAFVLAIVAHAAWAHDIPGEMRVHAFVKPEGERLQVLLRIPLALLLNLDLPKRGPGYIDLVHFEEAVPRALGAIDKGIAFFENGARLQPLLRRARISQPSERSFESYGAARALLAGPALPEATDVFWNQGYFDAHLEYPIRSPDGSFGVDFQVSPGLGDRLKLDLRYVSPEGVVRAFEVPTGLGAWVIDPRWHQAAWSFVKSGFAHILDGIDHLAFLLCLVIPFRRLDWYLVGVITSFTLAHSVTLIAAAYGLVPDGDWFPPLVETLIAASIVYTAIENIVRPNLSKRWLVSGLFGFVHGFGFSFLLKADLQFAGSHLLTSLVAFNVGIEAGQLVVLACILPVLGLLHRFASERVLIVVLSALIAHSAWHWLSDRAEALWKVNWPTFDIAQLATIASALLLLVAGALAWRGIRQLRRLKSTEQP